MRAQQFFAAIGNIEESAVLLSGSLGARAYILEAPLPQISKRPASVRRRETRKDCRDIREVCVLNATATPNARCLQCDREEAVPRYELQDRRLDIV